MSVLKNNRDVPLGVGNEEALQVFDRGARRSRIEEGERLVACARAIRYLRAVPRSRKAVASF